MIHYRSCHLCEATCGVAVEVEDDRVLSIRGDQDDPFSRGYVCPKVMGLADVHEDPDRLQRPMLREGDRWRETDWDEAFDRVAARLRDIRRAHGRDAIGVYQGNPTAHSLGLLTWGQMFLRRLGTRNLYSATSADQLPHMLSSLLMLGHQVLFPIPDIDRTDFFLVLGANPVVSNGSIMTAPDMRRRLKDLSGRGGTLVVIDPRRSETAAMADRHLPIEPGTDALLLLALLQVLFAEDLADLGRLAAHVRGLEAVRNLVGRFTPEEVAPATGIDAADIRRLARDFAGARRAVCYGRVGACTQEFGGLTSWLINLVNIATGNFDEPGGAMFTTPAVDLVRLASLAGHRGGFDRWRSRASDLPEFGGELLVAALAEEIETPGKGQIRALITSAGNPVLSIPNGARLERALPGLEFMVSIDPYLNETTRHADVILPPTFGLERDQYDLAFALVSVRNVARYAPAAIERKAHQRHDWEICAELAGRLAPGDGRIGGLLARVGPRLTRRVTPRAMVDAGLRAGPHKLSVTTLLEHPHGLDLGPLEPRLPALLCTPDRRIELAPAVYLNDLPRLRARMAPRPQAELRLIGRRHLRSNNSWMHNSRRLVKGKPRCTLLMHPDDAAVRGLASGDVAEITSRVGTVRAPVELSEDMKPGVVSLPHGWGHSRPGTRLRIAAERPGVSLNDLTDEAFVDRLSGTVAFSGVSVEVRPAATSAASATL